MKFRIKENFGEKREFEFEAKNMDMAYSKAMKLFNENNKSKIMDEYYYIINIIGQS